MKSQESSFWSDIVSGRYSTELPAWHYKVWIDQRLTDLFIGWLKHYKYIQIKSWYFTF